MKVDPIIAVNDVQASSAWYQALLSCVSIHGGSEFDVLATSEGEILLCLHKWGEHDHPTLAEAGNPHGNGLILYFRTNEIDDIWAQVKTRSLTIEKEMDLNPNSGKKEFSVRDLDGYYITISEYHEFGR
ncbi:MAG: hypothetical protein KTR32_31845 [Granulosicoccus sp.]|nr:hypothetical protein [Granulosicoccus sp.]